MYKMRSNVWSILKLHGGAEMEQHIKLFFMSLMNFFFDNNVNLKFDPNLELEMIKLPHSVALSWLIWSSIANVSPKRREKSID